MEREELSILSKKYLAGEASEEETARLLNWYNNYNEQELTALIEASEGETEALLEQRMHRRLMVATAKPKVYHTRWWAAAAAVLILLAAGGMYYLHESERPQNSSIAAGIMPGSNKATLTLADGSVVNLDSTGTGMLLKQGNTKVEKTASGEVVYKSDKTTETTVSYNVLRTPRGGQFKVILPDGTAVWLNAASSIRYPTAFTGKERTVSITGEAYFEIAPDAAKPFNVSVNNMKVIVLGTHFNINAYADEHTINTTLLEGAVLVQTGSESRRLAPGQQTRVKPGSNEIEYLKQTDVNSAIAWKNGYFSFNDEDIPSVMRQLARWYNIEVTYTDKSPEGTFTGEIGRTLTQDQLFKILSRAGIHFKIEGENRVNILP
ncbi:FecR family protein [Chitinophaga sp. YR573]|uniref:FecR family protein n=1 Tax=Chitinophaga sp. YR573 TaxID=1881040 RepID=UPI0008BDCF8C|nr:FecR family protein [Chitinophaga sp. YR573]SEW39952.1 FecR family protein [Chitinophaga sp. YR573]